MPTTIVLPGNRRVWLKVIQGVVIESSESEVSVVHQGRDQRQFIGDTMILRPGRIHSQIVSSRKVWIQEADGHESAFDLSDFPLDVRPGHALSLIFGAAEGIQDGTVFGALNTTSGQYSFDRSIHCDRLRPFGLYLPRSFYRKRMQWGLVVGAIGGILCSLLNKWDLSFVVAGVILGLVFSLLLALVQAAIKQLQGQRLVPKLNHLALALLLSKS